MLTHVNLHANIAAIGGPYGLNVGPSDVGVSWLPLYHDMGLIGVLLVAVHTHANAVIMSPVLFLKRPTAWLEALSQYRGTISFAPNFAYELCLRRVKPSQIGALDLSRWRVAGCGAEPLRADTLRAFGERFARAGFNASSFMPSYGLAEHSLAVTFCHQGLKVDSSIRAGWSASPVPSQLPIAVRRLCVSSPAAVLFPSMRSRSSTRTDANCRSGTSAGLSCAAHR